jgi:serine phosphatase RsbU (regulator of sigma subunit)
VNGDTFSIGEIPYSKKLEVKFHTQKLKIENGTKLYLMTDGYMDQFGGPQNKKFNQLPFEEMLNKISDLPMSEQKEKLLQTFTNWKGSNKQIDDVMVLGVQLS